MSGDALRSIIELNIKLKRNHDEKARLMHEYRMNRNRIDSLSDKIKMRNDIAIRELMYSMTREERERRRTSLEELFPESGPLNLTEKISTYDNYGE